MLVPAILVIANLVWAILVWAGPAAAQPADTDLRVVFAPGESIREIAAEHLGDADLWPDILRASGIATITDLTPGMELRVPVRAITAANRTLGEALTLIQEANQAGAQIFAPDEIGSAVSDYQEAQKHRLAHDWDAAGARGASAALAAAAALQKALTARDQAGEALVSDRRGDVEGQRPEDLAWRALQLRAILIEEEKVRTLSNSTAQITFRDASRLRLNANSNAIIEVMRFDPLVSREEAKVSLVEGDFYALLSGGGRDSFNVQAASVNASAKAGNFWASNSGDGAKFANYADEAIDVAAAGEAVTLGRNEGTVVAEGEAPTEAVALLPAPEPMAPADGAVVQADTPELSWTANPEAAGYWLEIAADANFSGIVDSQFGVAEPHHAVTGLAAGDYYWRVAALDGFGLPGPKSEKRRFTLHPDASPPYLTIEMPADNAVLRQATVTVSGRSEAGATVTINGVTAPTGADGGYSLEITAEAGDNHLAVVAEDAAGHRTTRKRRFTFMPDATSIVAFDPALRQVAPNHFLTNATSLSLAGQTTANAEIAIRADDTVVAAANTDAAGHFRLNLPTPADEQRFRFTVTSASGFASEEEIAVSVDREAPEIVLDAIPPRLTAETTLEIAGRSEAGARLTLNGDAVVLAGDRFTETLALASGDNRIELIASDAAGNVRVETFSVRLDQTPPVLENATAEPATQAGRPVLSITATASDASGLARAASFIVKSTAGEHSGYLRYNRASRLYHGTLALPEAELAAARLTRIELVDDAGNSRVFDID